MGNIRTANTIRSAGNKKGTGDPRPPALFFKATFPVWLVASLLEDIIGFLDDGADCVPGRHGAGYALHPIFLDYILYLANFLEPRPGGGYGHGIGKSGQPGLTGGIGGIGQGFSAGRDGVGLDKLVGYSLA